MQLQHEDHFSGGNIDYSCMEIWNLTSVPLLYTRKKKQEEFIV